MDTAKVGSGADAAHRKERRLARRFWSEKPAARFCVGFVVFVLAEVLVYVTIHWLIPIL